MEGDFDTGNVRYKARERYSFGVSDPRGIFGVEGAYIRIKRTIKKAFFDGFRTGPLFLW